VHSNVNATQFLWLFVAQSEVDCAISVHPIVRYPLVAPWRTSRSSSVGPRTSSCANQTKDSIH